MVRQVDFDHLFVHGQEIKSNNSTSLYMGMVNILVIGPGTFEQTVNSPLQFGEDWHCCFSVSEKLFKSS